MSKEIETVINADDMQVWVSEWSDGGVWLRMSGRHGSMYTPLTREQAEQMLAGLQAILTKEAA